MRICLTAATTHTLAPDGAEWLRTKLEGNWQVEESLDTSIEKYSTSERTRKMKLSENITLKVRFSLS